MKKNLFAYYLNTLKLTKMKKKNPKDEMIPGVGQNDKTSTEKPGTDINANNNSKDPATATDELRITAQADRPRNAEDAAGNVGDVVNGGGTPIAKMPQEAQIVALTTLARSLKEGAIDEEVFVEAARGVPHDNVKAALLRAGVHLDQRKRILDKNTDDNSKAPDPDTTHITASASSPRNAEEAAHNVKDVVNGGGTPIKDLDPQAIPEACRVLASALKEGSITKEVFLASVKGVPYKRIKAALKSAGVPAGTRDEILGSLPKK